jgi:serine/threonine protein kinase
LQIGHSKFSICILQFSICNLIRGEAVSAPNTDVAPAREFATRVWNQLSECVDAFISAWDTAIAPPRLADFLPNVDLAARRLMISELVKVDLEYRWKEKRFPKLLEEYLADFPELIEAEKAPCDLVYEEYHVRRQSGDAVAPETYFDRFPKQVVELRRLLKLEAPHLSTTLIAGPARIPANLGDRIDDFDLLTELGRGAFACVYLARQRSMQRLVALKVSADRGSEPQTLAQLDHPHIVRVYDQRTLPERKLRLLYMQYVAGGTLEATCEEIKRITATDRNGARFLQSIDRILEARGESAPTDSSTREKLASASWPQVVCWLGGRIAMALAHAHGCGVLHRDLKPANVLVAADGTPKLADFNISFASKLDGATPAAYFGGSLAYMSPEQLEACNPAHERSAEDLDGRSDVYSLGVLLWELLTGARPFPDEPATNNWSKMLTTMVDRRRQGVDPQTIARLPADCPAGLRDVLLKCLTFDVSQRFNAVEAARQFEICLQPRAQRLLHAPKTLWRSFVQSHPFLAAVALIVPTHVVMSFLNIRFNLIQLLQNFFANDWERVKEFFYNTLVVSVNTVAFSAGIGTMLLIAWPVFAAVKNNPRPVAAGGLSKIRRRCLWLGDYMAYIAFALWAASGLVIPGWLLNNYKTVAGDVIKPMLYFLASQCLFGIIAATLSFFIMSLLAVRYYYPRLLLREPADHDEATQLASLNRRMWAYYLLAISVPFLALILLVYSEAEKGITMWLGVFGLIGFLACFWIDRTIRDDLAALALIVNPSGTSLAGAETSDSFLTGSRR